MNNKIISYLLLVAIFSAAFFSCKKVNNSTTDPTLNYFPLILRQTNAHYVTYNVDSVYYDSTSCSRYEVKSMMKYVITDTVRNANDQLTYMMNVYTSPYPGGFWTPNSVIEITLAPTTVTNLADPTTTSLFYVQDQTNYVKLMFPIAMVLHGKAIRMQTPRTMHFLISPTGTTTTATWAFLISTTR